MSENGVDGDPCSSSIPNITKSFLESALQKKVKTFDVISGSNPGDNFTSVLYGVDVVLEDDSSDHPQQHLLLKLYPNHPIRQKFLDDTNLFWKEYSVYKTLIPEYMKLQKKVVQKKSDLLKLAFPPFVGGSAINYKNALSKNAEDEHKSDFFSNYILMQDVRKSCGFTMANKQLGLDFDHCALVVKELAKLHALSLAYKVHSGLSTLTSRFPFLAEAFLSDENVFIQPVAKSNFEMVLQLMETDVSLKGSEAMRSFRKLDGKIMDIFKMFVSPEGVDEVEARKLRRLMGPNEDENNGKKQWIVGGHGDCWINNMLFRYDPITKKPVEIMLVDLQVFRESCLTLDLVYFFYTSTDHNLRSQSLDSLLQLYADHFLQFCRILDTPPFPDFSVKELKRRFNRSKVLGFMMAILVLPIILTSPENSVNLDDVEVKASGKEGEEGEIPDLSDLLDSMKVKEAGDQNLMQSRFQGMILELHKDGVL